MTVVPQLADRRICKLQIANCKFAFCNLQFAIYFSLLCRSRHRLRELRLNLFVGLFLTFFMLGAPQIHAGPDPTTYWQVDDVRPGMKGFGRTVIHGTKVETFDAEVLGILKNTSPGRDMILCRLSGLGLEKTGVIAGMSGSPIYVDGKLLGAVAFAWPFGKEPIAGVTPFCQMHAFVESFERHDRNENSKSEIRNPKNKEATDETRKKHGSVSVFNPCFIRGCEFNGRSFEAVTVSENFEEVTPKPEDGLWMMPLRTPLSATGFTEHSLRLLGERVRSSGLLPMQGGGASASVRDQEKNAPLEPGGPLAVAMVVGDFDLSGIGTVTHIDGGRVYGWGHPFFGCGNCEFPLMTGYIHTIYPRQNVSFKMGSPLKTVGAINADVSTCIAGWMGRTADMLPVHMTVVAGPGDSPKTYHVEVARQRALLASLVLTVLTNAVDMEGEWPEEMTAELQARIEVDGRPPIVIKDTFSGASYSGGRAPPALYSQIAAAVNLLTFNPYKPVRLKQIDCETHLMPGRQTAEIEAIALDSETYSPGETLKATVYLLPYKGIRQRVAVELQLPADLPEGSYGVLVCDDLTNVRRQIRDNPNLSTPQSLDQLFETLHVQTSVQRTHLIVRVPLEGVGVALDGNSLPDLPPSMVQILGNTRKTGAQTTAGALVSRHKTNWVIQGSESARFTVTKNKKVSVP
jgi:hypothetical protein